MQRPTPLPDDRHETDAELMAAVGEGNMGAFGRLYRRHASFVDHAIVATAPFLNRSDVEDLCQDVFLAIHRSAGRYREDGRFRSWLYSVAVRTTKERRRSYAIRRRLLSLWKKEEAFSADGPADPDARIRQEEVRHLMEKLPEVQRQILVLFEQDELSGEEIAQLLNLNINTVWTHLRRGRAALAALVTRQEKAGGR